MTGRTTALAALATVVVAALCGGVLAEETSGCKYEKDGATFDLSPLMKSGTHYSYEDDNTSAQDPSDYLYDFNVCSNVDDTPSQCKDTGAKVPAYQINKGDDTCKTLSNSDGSWAWSLIDSTNPAKGVKLAYSGGQACSNGDERALTVVFPCEDEAGTDVTGTSQGEVDALETGHCKYEVSLGSHYGCPQECPLGKNKKLCSGNGYCNYDKLDKVPRCFCYSNYQGDDCSIKGSPPADPIVALLAVLITLIVLAIGAGAFVFLRMRKLKNGAPNYVAFGGDSSTPAGGSQDAAL